MTEENKIRKTDSEYQKELLIKTREVKRSILSI